MRRAVLHLFSRKDKVISRGGRPHLDYLMMFKVLLLQRLHHLSDDAMDYQLLDRLSFRRFVGCHEDTVPDAKTIWLYRETLTKSGRETVGTRLNGAKKTSMRLGHAKVMSDMLAIKTIFVSIENQNLSKMMRSQQLAYTTPRS